MFQTLDLPSKGAAVAHPDDPEDNSNNILVEFHEQVICFIFQLSNSNLMLT